MSSWLDGERIDWSQPEPEELLRLLAGAYGSRDIVVELATQAGLGPEDVPVHDSMNETWQQTLDRAAELGRLRALAEAAMLHPEGEAWRGVFAELLQAPAPAAPPLPETGNRPAIHAARGGASALLLIFAGAAVLAAVVALVFALRG